MSTDTLVTQTTNETKALALTDKVIEAIKHINDLLVNDSANAKPTIKKRILSEAKNIKPTRKEKAVRENIAGNTYFNVRVISEVMRNPQGHIIHKCSCTDCGAVTYRTRGELVRLKKNIFCQQCKTNKLSSTTQQQQ